MVGLRADDTNRRRLVLVALLAVTCLLGSRGISDESAVMLSGDMARYVMNGVFMHDLIADGGVTSYSELTQYSQRYYARYPALSLGHHPPIPSLSVLPFFWVFGVSLFAARLAAVCWFLAAVWGLYSVGTRLFTWRVAAWATALFATNVVVLRAGQYLVSEMPMTALVLWALYALIRYCETRRPVLFVTFVGLAMASLWAKQLAVLMFPVYAVVLGSYLGWRNLFTRRALVAAAVLVALAAPVAIMTVGLAPANLKVAMSNLGRIISGRPRAPASHIVATILTTHLSWQALAVTSASLLLLIVRRRRQALIGIVWIVSVVTGAVVLAGTTEPGRYAFGALPAYFLIIGALAYEIRTPPMKIASAVVLAAMLWWQVWSIRHVHPSGAGGYEAAAEYVLAQNREPAVMYHSNIDTGYFVFFTRKHDPARRQVVMRADKLLGWGTYDRLADLRRVHERLQRFGIRWVVVETDSPTASWHHALYEELAGGRFVERQRFPVVSTAAQDMAIVVYEYLDARPADLDAEMAIELPLGSRSFGIRLRDLTPVAR